VTESRKGLFSGVLAYTLWGIVAAYWRLLRHVDPIELVAHRAVWGLGAFGILVVIARQPAALGAALREPRTIGVMLVSGTLLAVNWIVFVWATVSGHLLEASLGYFMNPLVSIALGTLVLGERLRRLQWIAIALAATGVGFLTWRAGRVPWVSLLLAVSWGLYGLVRKTVRVEALVGSAIETLLLAPIAAVYLALRGTALQAGEPQTIALLVGTGVVTAIPLILFTVAARRLPLSTVGFLQYLAPTGQFLLAVLAYGEPLAHDRLIAFVLIWIGLAAFSVDLAQATRKRQI
jgi:chloramphenicol-sensitive protein RarD